MAIKKRTLRAIDLNGSPLDQFGGNEFEIWEDTEGKVHITLDKEKDISGATIDNWNQGGGSSSGYLPIPETWDQTVNTQTFCDSIATDSNVKEGDVYFGRVSHTVYSYGTPIKIEVLGKTETFTYLYLTAASQNALDYDVLRGNEYRYERHVYNSGSISVRVSGWQKFGTTIASEDPRRSFLTGIQTPDKSGSLYSPYIWSFHIPSQNWVYDNTYTVLNYEYKAELDLSSLELQYLESVIFYVEFNLDNDFEDNLCSRIDWDGQGIMTFYCKTPDDVSGIVCTLGYTFPQPL